MSVSSDCCVLSGRVLCDGLSLVQSSPTECGVSQCDLKNSTMMRPRPTRAVQQWEKEWYLKLHLIY